MICLNPRSSKKRTKCDSIYNRFAVGAASGYSRKTRQDKPVAIYSKKFAESCHGDERIFYNNKRATLYKTEMCRSFSETGTCRYGDSCQFCHSESELRTVERHPKYKTEICRTFWLEGSCPYGKRCCFAHLDNADLVEKVKRLGTLQKQIAAKNQENAQLSTFRFAIDDTLQDCPDEDSVCMHSCTAGHCGQLCSIYCGNTYVCMGEGLERSGSRHATGSLLSLLGAGPATKLRAGTEGSSPGATAPDLFSNNTEFNNTLPGRNEAFTFNRYYSKSFSPATAAELSCDICYQSTWSLNKLNIWKDDPLNFILEEAPRQQRNV